MNTRLLTYLLALVATFMLGALWSQYAFVAAAQAQEGAAVAPLGDAPAKNPVVASTVHRYVTENEEDPFAPERVRRTRTTVTSVLLVYADGTTSVQKAPGR